jgi:DNA polymerase-3 subunit gamma/tau
MSYLVLARKWRPRNFEEVIGQPHVTKTLLNAIRLKRTAHAYLFTGARGVGKTSVARILAKTLNCERDVTPSPCDECSNCLEIAQGRAVDVLEIDGASNRGIDSIRELRETVRYRPAKSRYKIYIIDEVHMLTTEAFNALLKTLEEPPDHVLFIFATTEPHKIPATILSRCQRFDFRRIPTQQIVSHLEAIVQSESVDLSESVLYAVAREADGSMRDAQSLLEQLLAFSGDGLSDEEILDLLGVVDRRSVFRVGEAILTGDVGTCLQVVGDLYRRGIDSRRFCQQLCDYFRSLLFLALGTDGLASHIDLPDEEKNLLKNQVGKTTPESLHLYFQMILKGEEEIRRSTLPRITLEMLLLRLAQLPRLESLETVLEKLTDLENQLRQRPGDMVCERPTPLARASAPAKAGPERSLERPARPMAERAIAEQKIPERAMTEPAPLEGAAPGEFSAEEPPVEDAPVSQTVVVNRAERPMGPGAHFSPEESVSRWPAFLLWLEGRDPVLAAKLNGSLLASATEEALEVEVREGFEEILNTTQTQTKLSEAASGYYGRAFKWVFRAKKPVQPEPQNEPKARRAKPNSRRMVLEHPMVQQAMEILGGELIDIRPLEKGKGKHGKGEAPAES